MQGAGGGAPGTFLACSLMRHWAPHTLSRGRASSLSLRLIRAQEHHEVGWVFLTHTALREGEKRGRMGDWLTFLPELVFCCRFTKNQQIVTVRFLRQFEGTGGKKRD